MVNLRYFLRKTSEKQYNINQNNMNLYYGFMQ